MLSDEAEKLNNNVAFTPRTLEQAQTAWIPPKPEPELEPYLGLFKYGESPITWTNHQAHIIETIIFKPHHRVQCIAVTQYGKSLAVACALIIDAAINNERWAIVAPNDEKAGIIMGYVVEHIFDSPLFYSQLIFDEPLEKMKQERSRKRITFKGGGEVRIFSAQAKNKRAVSSALTGFGSKNIILDESSLIPNELYAMVKRMLGGHKNNFLFEIGNPFNLNHFVDTWRDPLYYHIYIDYMVALMEGRFTESFISEMKKLPFFSVLYQCIFPAESEILADGWRRIILRNVIQNAFTKEWNPTGQGRLGVDVAGGGNDSTVLTVRFDNVARIVKKLNVSNIMDIIPIVIEVMEDYNISAEYVFIDDTGIGQGVSNRMQEMGYAIHQVKLGESAEESDKYSNVRAENHWLGANWIKEGGKLYENEYVDENGRTVRYSDGFYDFEKVNYKEDTNSKLKLEPKMEMMAREGIKSPDELDSLILTFSNKTIVTSLAFGF